MLKKKTYIIAFIFITILIYAIIILYIHNILFHLNLKIIILLLKNKINFFKFIITNDVSLMNSPNNMSSGDFQLLIIELMYQ